MHIADMCARCSAREMVKMLIATRPGSWLSRGAWTGAVRSRVGDTDLNQRAVPVVAVNVAHTSHVPRSRAARVRDLSRDPGRVPLRVG